MTRSRTMVAALAMCIALVAAACGSSGGSDTSTPTYGTGGSTTPTTTAKGSAPVKLTGTVNDKGTKDISDKGADASISIEMDDNYFSPTYVKAAPGAKVEIELENEGENAHTFTLDDGSIDQKVSPDGKATVTVTVPESGSLRFSCDFHGSMGMQGAFYTS